MQIMADSPQHGSQSAEGRTKDLFSRSASARHILVEEMSWFHQQLEQNLNQPTSLHCNFRTSLSQPCSILIGASRLKLIII